MAPELRNPLGAIGKDAPSGRLAEDGETRAQQTDVQDPLAGMAEIDKWGIKGLRTLMNNYPDYNAMVIGLDPSTLGLDLSSPE
jgi:CCR4-NOT transcription complex subunit 2